MTGENILETVSIPQGNGVEDIEYRLYSGVWDGEFSFLGHNSGELTRIAMGLSGLDTGDIGVVLTDDLQKRVALKVTIENGTWRETALLGFQTEDGEWESWASRTQRR
jgi:hypothetical protein